MGLGDFGITRGRVRAMVEEYLAGQIEVGDTVITLARTRAVEGVVTLIRKGKVYITGAHYPGGPEVKCGARLEDVALKSKGNKHG
jgi:hypothetical protein